MATFDALLVRWVNFRPVRTVVDVHFGGISVFTQIKLIAVTRLREEVVAAMWTHETAVGSTVVGVTDGLVGYVVGASVVVG